MPVEGSCFTHLRLLTEFLLLDSEKLLDFCPGSGDLSGFRLTIRQTLSDLNRPAALLRSELMPNTAITGTNEQPQLAVVGVISQEVQHLLCVGAAQPLFFGHNPHRGLKTRDARGYPDRL